MGIGPTDRPQSSAAGAVQPVPPPSAAMFQGPADAYDSFMGRYSRALAPLFADFCLPAVGRFLDVGCGPGALTAVAVDRLGAQSVAAADPAAQFVEACRSRHPGVEVVLAPAEALPFPRGSFAAAAAQLVFHFIADPHLALDRLTQVVTPGGLIAACVWDGVEGMEMLNAFWGAAEGLGLSTDQGTLRLGRPGELAGLWQEAGLEDVTETTMRVSTTYNHFEELWNTFLTGTGPAGRFVMSLGGEAKVKLKAAMWERLGRPEGAFDLSATGRAVRGRVPG